MTNRDNKPPKRADIYEEFILWFAMPPSERFKFGIETQEEFVEYYQIGINTPTAWKRRPDFEARVTVLRREWAFGKTGAIIEGIYRAALKGNPFSQKLWLQYFHGFSEKQEVTVTNQRSASADDIITLIEALPEEKRKKHYAWLTELLLDASIAQQAAQRIGSAWGDHLPTEWQPRYTLRDNYLVEEPPTVERQAAEPKIVHFNDSADSCDPYAVSQTQAADLV